MIKLKEMSGTIQIYDVSGEVQPIGIQNLEYSTIKYNIILKLKIFACALKICNKKFRMDSWKPPKAFFL